MVFHIIVELLSQRKLGEKATVRSRKLPWQQGSSEIGKLSNLGKTDQVAQAGSGWQQRILVGNKVKLMVAGQDQPTERLLLPQVL
jgi:hypothetical protein